MTKTHIGKFLLLIFLILSFFDLLYPSKGEDVNRIVPQIGRAIFFGLMLLTIINVKLMGYSIPQTITGVGVKYLLFLFIISSLFFLELVFENFFSFIKIFYWITGYYFFYFGLISGFFKIEFFEKLVPPLVLIYFLVILRDYYNADLFKGRNEFFVSNNAYHLLKLFPLVLLFRNKWTYFLLILISVGIILAFKRGALLAFALGFFVFYLYILFKEKKQKLIKILAGLSVISVASFYFIENSDVFIKRLNDFESVETAGSGRGRMFSLIIDHMVFENSDPFVLLFGHGIYSTLDFFQATIGNRIIAHSDILEFFYDYGLLGLICIFFFFFRILNLMFFYKSSYYGWVIGIWFICIGLSSTYSINFFGAEMIYAIIPIVLLEYKRNFMNQREYF